MSARVQGARRRAGGPASPRGGGARPRPLGRATALAKLGAALLLRLGAGCGGAEAPGEGPGDEDPQRGVRAADPAPEAERSGAGAADRGATDPGVTAPLAPAPPAEPGVRVRALAELSPFTPQMVSRLRAIRAVSDRRQDDVFMKIGDSSTVSRGFLECFGDPDLVELGAHPELEPTRAYFDNHHAAGRDSYRRASLAAHEGWSARQVLHGRPPPLLREVRAIRPRFAFVMNGGNDVEGGDDYVYATRMLRIVGLLEDNGIIPVLNSLPPRADDDAADRLSRRFNQVSWAVARAHRLPYLDYRQVMERLPRRGLAGDGVHPNIFIEGSQGHACRLHEAGLAFGHNARNLLALRALDALRRTVVLDEDAPAPAEPPTQGAGTAEAPRTVRELPFAELVDTAVDGSASIDAYPGCDAEQPEAGREVVYRLVVREPLRLRALAVSRGDADADVHLLRGAARGDACVERADREIVRDLEPGEWLVSVDTFSGGGEPAAGEVLVLLAPATD